VLCVRDRRHIALLLYGRDLNCRLSVHFQRSFEYALQFVEFDSLSAFLPTSRRAVRSVGDNSRNCQGASGLTSFDFFVNPITRKTNPIAKNITP